MNLVCNWCHKKGYIRANCWNRKKKQPDTSVVELTEGDEENCDFLSIIDRSCGNKDIWITNSECSHHISSNRKTSTTSKAIGKWTIYFRSHEGRITTLQGVHHVPKLRYNLIFLGTLHGEGFRFSFEGDVMKVSKDAYVKFQVECVGDVYMLRNSVVTVGGL